MRVDQMDTLCLPPFWETHRDSDLTIALINAQYSERRAESRLIERRMKRIMIEQELYSHMAQKTSHRLDKANVSVGITCGVLRASGLAPVGKTFDYAGSDVESDVDVS